MPEEKTIQENNFPEKKLKESRERVFALERSMLQFEAVDIDIDHLFCNGMYARTMYVPKGITLTGKIHKYPQINICAKGDVTVFMENGPIRVGAGFHTVSPAGAKRAFYAHEDSIWIVILKTDETDIEKIEGELVTNSEQEYLEFKEDKKCLL